MKVAAGLLDPPPEPLRHARRSYFWFLLNFPFVLAIAWVGLKYPDFRIWIFIATWAVPAIMIEARFKYLRAYRPGDVPVPLFETTPPLYERLIWWRRAIGTLTLGVGIGGESVMLSKAIYPTPTAFVVLLWLGFTFYFSLDRYIKVRNGLRTA